ncbi:MAG: hypothetical protein ABW220_19945 [Burkholderiaceae bacterium]
MMAPIQIVPVNAEAMGAMVAWVYFVTNAARVVTYVPQIVVVWRSRDGAHAISLLTWGSWVVSHLAAVLYGAAVVRDLFFVVISSINLICCAAVTSIAALRRREAARLERARTGV